MGEQADYMLDQIIDEMAREGTEFEDEDYVPPAHTCKFCGKSGLYWHHTGAGWRLFTDAGNLHACREYLA